MLEQWQQRVIEEREALTSKIDKLRDFLDSDFVFEVKREDHLSLQKQLHAMTEYESALMDRISRFPQSTPPIA